MSDSERLKEVAPFPWKSYKIRYKTRSRPHLYRLVDAQDLTVLSVPGKEGTGTGDRAKEIAEFIVHVANCHEELLAAVGDALEIITWMSGSNDFSEEGQAHEGWVKAREKLTRMFTTYYKAGGKRE